MHPQMQNLQGLSVAERLELVQDLWDSIDAASEQLPVQEWHRQLVQARIAQSTGNREELGLTRDQVWQQVEQRRGS